MGILVHNAIKGAPMATHPFFKDIIQNSTTCILDPRILQCYGTALDLLAEAIKKDSIDMSTCSVCVMFTDHEVNSFTTIPPTTQGVFLSLIVYQVDRWKSKQFNDTQIVLVLLEELVHYMYQIRDESLVKDKVTEIIQLGNPGVTKIGLYSQFNDPSLLK